MSARLLEPVLRRALATGDAAAVERLVRATGFFSPAEVEIAIELVNEAAQHGDASDYHFLFYDGADGAVVAYACYGPIPLTRGSYDLYWIAVDPAAQRRGLGRQLLDAVEADTRARGGARLYVDTSSRAQYRPTRAFYERCGYRQAAHLEDFYAPGDGKVIYLKTLG